MSCHKWVIQQEILVHKFNASVIFRSKSPSSDSTCQTPQVAQKTSNFDHRPGTTTEYFVPPILSKIFPMDFFLLLMGFPKILSDISLSFYLYFFTDVLSLSLHSDFLSVPHGFLLFSSWIYILSSWKCFELSYNVKWKMLKIHLNNAEFSELHQDGENRRNIKQPVVQRMLFRYLAQSV